MLSRMRRIGRVIFCFCILVCGLTISPVPQPVRGELPSANIINEVRLRRLHLVRPDLIPYPMAYEVYC
jgi:hypothetical protein